MIKIILGNLGSGKTASVVRDLKMDDSGRITYTNLALKGIKNAILIKPQNLIVKKEDEKKKVFFDLNVEFWNEQKKPLNILWDEIHLTANSRSSMTSINKIFSRFLSMGRRITGFDKRGYGKLTFIAQTDRTVDINLRELTTDIQYNIGRWIINCQECKFNFWTNSEKEQIDKCPKCFSWNIEKKNFIVECNFFRSWGDYYVWKDGLKVRHKKIILNDIEDYFKCYDTLQMENMWEDYII